MGKLWLKYSCTRSAHAPGVGKLNNSSRTKTFLSNIDYDLADEKEQEKIMEEISKQGGSAFPFVMIGGKVVIGYNPEKFSELLDL